MVWRQEAAPSFIGRLKRTRRFSMYFVELFQCGIDTGFALQRQSQRLHRLAQRQPPCSTPLLGIQSRLEQLFRGKPDITRARCSGMVS